MRLVNLKNLQNQPIQRKEKKALTFKNINILFEGRQKVLNDFESKIFPRRKQTQGT